eukprot:TRINITY_DN45321_c0_g1_i1.p1 TRINITY_DN45321_c0_g1~~TRINITY_DN45321_c0_g1_i1.p1  ORF type:complete len:328 (-),score=34.53 TRINITY_DN45321_c0_g1_i1:374-1357(-)
MAIASPEAPTLHVVDATTLRISWSALNDAEEYYVLVSDGQAGGGYVDFPTEQLKPSKPEARSGRSTTVLVKYLKSSTAYMAQVAAKTSDVWSSFSPSSLPVGLPRPLVPGAPSLMPAGWLTLHLCWPGVPGATSYSASTNHGYVDFPTGFLTAEAKDARPGTSTSVILQGLDDRLSYTAQVAARQGKAWSDYSASSALVHPPSPVAPSAPSLHVVSGTALRISWSAVPDASFYAVCVADDWSGTEKFYDFETGLLKGSAKDAGAVAATSVTITGLTSSQGYRARVAAQQGGIWSDYSKPSDSLVLPSLAQAMCPFCHAHMCKKLRVD